jgi:uncharacterized membrane protein YgaE (UPF0421/DUF939 family)
MKFPRDLLLANVLALFVLLVVLLIGWKEEAAFGLAVLIFLDLMVLLRGRQTQSRDDSEE